MRDQIRNAVQESIETTVRTAGTTRERATKLLDEIVGKASERTETARSTVRGFYHLGREGAERSITRGRDQVEDAVGRRRGQVEDAVQVVQEIVNTGYTTARSQVNEAVELLQKGGVLPTERVQEVTDRLQSQVDGLYKGLDTQVRSGLTAIGVATGDDVKALRGEVASLKRRDASAGDDVASLKRELTALKRRLTALEKSSTSRSSTRSNGTANGASASGGRSSGSSSKASTAKRSTAKASTAKGGSTAKGSTAKGSTAKGSTKGTSTRSTRNRTSTSS
jgi:polyhydroxyalkanoate synthesis regulator phasin